MAREMKESGIEWVGDIPSKWSVYPARYAFSEIREKNSNGIITNALKFYNGTIIRKTNFEADSDDYVADTITNYTIVKPDTIMINGLNLNYDLKSLRVGLVKETGVITSAYLALWPDRSRILPEYATYLFKGYETKMAFHNMGAGIRKTLGFKEFKHQPILIPSMDEQLQIVAFLDSQCSRIDAVIEKTRASIEEYKKLKQAVITRAVTKGIRGDRPMKDSGVEWIGEIPAEWIIRPLKTYIDILPGYAFSSNDFDTENGIPLLRGINVTPNGIRWDETVYWNQPISQQLKPFELFENDLVVGLDRPWISDGTRVAFVTKNDLPCLLLQRVCRIRSKDNIDLRFVYHAIAGKSFEEALSTDTTGVSVPHISTKQIQNFMVAIPPLFEQNDICDFLDRKCKEIDVLIERKHNLLSELEKYKKSLIFEYVTGKKEVPAS